MVECDKKYWLFVLELRNEFGNCFIDQEEISIETHNEFMNKNKENYFICLSKNDSPLGWVGVVNNDIRIAVDSNSQKKGVGKFMLQFIKERYPYATAKIFKQNEASLNLFNSVGIDFYVI